MAEGRRSCYAAAPGEGSGLGGRGGGFGNGQGSDPAGRRGGSAVLLDFGRARRHRRGARGPRGRRPGRPGGFGPAEQPCPAGPSRGWARLLASLRAPRRRSRDLRPVCGAARLRPASSGAARFPPARPRRPSHAPCSQDRPLRLLGPRIAPGPGAASRRPFRRRPLPIAFGPVPSLGRGSSLCFAQVQPCREAAFPSTSVLGRVRALLLVPPLYFGNTGEFWLLSLLLPGRGL